MGVTSSVFEAVRLNEAELREVSARTMNELMLDLVEYPISFADFTSKSKVQRYFIVEEKRVELDADFALEYEQIVKFADKITTSDNHVCYILKIYYRLIVGSSLFEQAMQDEKGIADTVPGFCRDKPGYLDITALVGKDLGMTRYYHDSYKDEEVVSEFSYVLTRRTHKNARLFYSVG